MQKQLVSRCQQSTGATHVKLDIQEPQTREAGAEPELGGESWAAS